MTLIWYFCDFLPIYGIDLVLLDFCSTTMVLLYVNSVLPISLNGSLGKRKIIIYFPVDPIRGTVMQKNYIHLFLLSPPS